MIGKHGDSGVLNLLVVVVLVVAAVLVVFVVHIWVVVPEMEVGR